ncbi:choice-of-anchor J domain-containing protein [Paraliomyxa miuraensis]|uniref:choice-of-anchor J domain-containing protein n=1 Tax=Paraliomyxa miuraensis TaxID=376150 RepID=UPI002258112B|nr:choice-of-anchor J domain-containing protein [Paraliomyxa miuraensis]MCX4246031.1 choice-of-anchor J domain-containing protein [Paraliomyxa miuraensis]
MTACPDDAPPIDTEASSTGNDESTTGVGPTTTPPTSTTIDPDSSSGDPTTGGPMCEPECAPGECCQGGFCFDAPQPSCNPGCEDTEVCQCPEGSDPCSCIAECVSCGTPAADYVSCLDMPCPDGEACILDDPMDPTFGVCAPQGCGEDACACPLPPGGTALNACADFTGDDGGGSCYLDCSDGTCPDGMICRTLSGNSACVWPGEGLESDCCFSNGTPGCDDMACQDTVCAADPFCCSTEWDQICADQVPDACPGLCPEPPEPGYGNCGLANIDCAMVETCIDDGMMMMDPTWAVCTQGGCTDAGDCGSLVPPTGDAPVACADPSGMGGPNTCYLDCSGGQTCPDGMSCIASSWCAWPQGLTTFSDDFQTGDLSAGWTLNNVDGLAPDPNVDFVNDAWVVADVFAAGEFEAISTSWYAPAGMSDDWLISPQIMLGANTRLYWTSQTIDPGFPDTLEVRISIAGTMIADFEANPPLLVADPELDVPVNHFVDLAPAGYMNQPVHIAFRNLTFDGFLLTVDDVVVVDLP